MEERTVLIHEFVTGGGLAGEALPPSWSAEGSAMRRALAEDFAGIEGVSVVMTLDARLPDEPGPWRIERLGPGEEPAAFARLASESDLTLCVAPETDGILEARARIIESSGGRSLGCRPEAIALCGDKLRLGEHLRSRDIPTPPTIRVAPLRGLPRDHPYPAVLKPIDGAGALDTFFIESPDDVPEAALAMPEAILQPFVPGRPMSAAYLARPGAEPLFFGLADQAIERRGGRFAYLGGRVPSRLGFGSGGFRTVRHAFGDSPLIGAIRSVPGLAGWVGVDFLWDEAAGRLVVLEINPRVTTSYIGFRRAIPPVRPGTSRIAGLWLANLESPRTPAVSAFCQHITKAPPVTFSADGRIEREAAPS